jgi:hypothetical protein
MAMKPPPGFYLVVPAIHGISIKQLALYIRAVLVSFIGASQ